MELIERQIAFYNKIQTDNRVGPSHISLYFVLLHEWIIHNEIAIQLIPEFIMTRAKICSRVTYNKRLRELHLYGYIEYLPSFSPGETVVKMIELITQNDC